MNSTNDREQEPIFQAGHDGRIEASRGLHYPYRWLTVDEIIRESSVPRLTHHREVTGRALIVNIARANTNNVNAVLRRR